MLNICTALAGQIIASLGFFIISFGFYIRAFPKRYSKLYSYIEVARVFTETSSATETINTLLISFRPALVIVDDKIYNTVNYPNKVRESLARRKHEIYLRRVADNLANYFRILLRDNPRRFREELRKFEK